MGISRNGVNGAHAIALAAPDTALDRGRARTRRQNTVEHRVKEILLKLKNAKMLNVQVLYYYMRNHIQDTTLERRCINVDRLKPF